MLGGDHFIGFCCISLVISTTILEVLKVLSHELECPVLAITAPFNAYLLSQCRIGVSLVWMDCDIRGRVANGSGVVPSGRDLSKSTPHKQSEGT